MRQHAGVFAANFSSNLLWQNCFAPKKSASCAEPRRVAAGILDVCQGGATMGLRQTRLLRRMFSYARRPNGRSFFMRLSKKPVIASQCSHWRGNPFLKRTNPALFAGFCLKRCGFPRRFAPRSKCPWGTPRNDRGGVYRHAEKKNALAGRSFLCMRVYLLRYSSMDLAPSLPAPMARMTVAAPVTASPPAYTA